MKQVFAVVAITVLAAGCSVVVPISGHERDTVSNGCARGHDRYDGCFWNDDLWEDDWLTKKDTERTLKIVRARIMPWYPLAAVCTLGIWVPVTLEWEMNGDCK